MVFKEEEDKNKRLKLTYRSHNVLIPSRTIRSKNIHEEPVFTDFSLINEKPLMHGSICFVDTQW